MIFVNYSKMNALRLKDFYCGSAQEMSFELLNLMIEVINQQAEAIEELNERVKKLEKK